MALAVTAALVTRGDVPVDEMLASIPKAWDVCLYDNSSEQSDLAVYARYEAIRRACTDVVYTQDDDCILAPESFRELVRAYRPGVLTTNMPERFRAHYSDSALIGFGSIFDKDMPFFAFDKLPSRPPGFELVCDVYFTALTDRHQWLDLAYRNLPWAESDTRMYRQPDHVGSRAKALEHARGLR